MIVDLPFVPVEGIKIHLDDEEPNRWAGERNVVSSCYYPRQGLFQVRLQGQERTPLTKELVDRMLKKGWEPELHKGFTTLEECLKFYEEDLDGCVVIQMDGQVTIANDTERYFLEQLKKSFTIVHDPKK